MIVAAHDMASDTLSADVVIVGGGATGLALASRLRRNVLVIEGGGLNPDHARDWQFRVEETGIRSDASMMRRRMVGGMGTLWSGRCAELNPVDFEMRKGVDHSGWPVTAAELAPWYAAARQDLLLPPTDEPDRPPRKTKRDRRPDVGSASTAGLDIQSWLYAFQAPEKSLDLGRHYLPNFQRDDKTLMTDANVVRLVGDGRRISHLELETGDKRRITVQAREFVLACGCIEANRLLLDNAEHCPDLIGPISGWLGQGFHQHLLIDGGRIEADVPQAAALQVAFNRVRSRRTYARETGVRLSDDLLRQQPLMNISGTFRYAAGRFRSPAELFDLSRRLLIGREPVFARPKIALELSVEQRIVRSNAITLSAERDGLGCRRASVAWTMADQELETVAAFSRIFATWIEAAGLGRYTAIDGIDAVRAMPMRDSLHHMGGTRMSRDASTGVVDRDLRLHGSHNLSIVGGSVFPTGGHVNPTLTMLALSARLADRLSAEAGVTVASTEVMTQPRQAPVTGCP